MAGYNVSDILKAVVPAATGFLFGVALHKGQVYQPLCIFQQMLFRRFVMLKMFLGAVAVSQLVFSSVTLLGRHSSMARRAIDNARATASSHRTFRRVALGAGLLGAGMSVAGACPGMVLAQVGAGTNGAVSTLLGGLTGAVMFAYLQPYIPLANETAKPKTISDAVKVPYPVLGFASGSILGGLVLALEYVYPYDTELVPGTSTQRLGIQYGLQADAWPPSLCGALIGSLQIPLMFCVPATLGSSSAYMRIVSCCVSTDSQDVHHIRYGKYWWQVIYVGSAVAGGYVSAVSSNSFGLGDGLPTVNCFIGGALLLFGSRFASGCTSGHGLSGFGFLTQQSFVAVCAMFGGGIATAIALNQMVPAYQQLGNL